MKVKFGTNKRDMSFSKIKEVLDIPDLIKSKNERFLKEIWRDCSGTFPLL